ncbi:MAG: hypothetical protein Q8P41_18650 [Pseudomonadota bacterium]|nr:hypothetical protein [Pseudomonadota bacterium]
MRRSLVLLARAIGGAVVAAQLAGALLFTLVIAVEAADEAPATLLQTIVARLPSLWAQAAAVLVLCGVAVAVVRLRRTGVLLGLGTLGVEPRVVLIVGALIGGAVGVGASRVVVEPSDAPGAWDRGDVGWIRDGEAWPDVSGGAVHRRPPEGRDVVTDVVNGGAAGALGAALGLYVGAAPTLVAAALLLVADVVARGLAERGAVPPLGVMGPALLATAVLLALLVAAPLFPRRWS